ncbi:unnamed protein product [Amoebophrya sp. A25]|nr:unnamed protein product [Amoebophrya sp. A25]|eukprot:GSA25T00008134001.1
MVDFEEFKMEFAELRHKFEDHQKETVENNRKKEATLREMMKEMESQAKQLKQIKKAAEETRRFFRDALSQQLGDLKEQLEKTFEEQLSVSDRMIRSRISEIIDKKFVEGFEVIEKQCKDLFTRIQTELMERAKKHEEESRALVDARSSEVESKVNSRCKELIQVRMGRVEQGWFAMCAKTWIWSVDNFNEKIFALYNVKENLW